MNTLQLSALCLLPALAAQPALAQAPVADAVLADEPVAYYRFDETSGADAADAADGHDAITVGGVDLAAGGPTGPGFGVPNSAAGFERSDGTAVLLGVGLASDLEGASGVSFAFWVDLDAEELAAHGKESLVLLFIGVADDNGGGLTTGGNVTIRNQRLRVGGRSQAGDGFQAGGNLRLDDRADGPMHVAGVLDFAGGTITTYFDGEQVDQKKASFGGDTFQPGLAGSSVGAVLNGQGKAANGFTGVLDEVAIFGVALTAEQVAQQHAAAALEAD